MKFRELQIWFRNLELKDRGTQEHSSGFFNLIYTYEMVLMRCNKQTERQTDRQKFRKSDRQTVRTIFVTLRDYEL